MNYIIALSSGNIINTVLARSALRHHLKPDRPPLLTRAQIPALSVLIANAFSSLAASIGAKADVSNQDVLTMTFDGRNLNNNAIADSCERAVTAAILSEAYADTDRELSNYYASLYESALNAIQSLLTSAATITPSIF